MNIHENTCQTPKQWHTTNGPKGPRAQWPNGPRAQGPKHPMAHTWPKTNGPGSPEFPEILEIQTPNQGHTTKGTGTKGPRAQRAQGPKGPRAQGPKENRREACYCSSKKCLGFLWKYMKSHENTSKYMNIHENTCQTPKQWAPPPMGPWAQWAQGPNGPMGPTTNGPHLAQDQWARVSRTSRKSRKSRNSKHPTKGTTTKGTGCKK